MGGLGNGRRGGRSPPLLIAALIACILILGFNYWVSSSRNLELQTKLYELEGHVRRGAAERGAAEVKQSEFQGEIQRQKDQIVQIENSYKRKLEEVQTSCSQDQAAMQLNISYSVKTIEELRSQLNQLNDDLGKAQKELQICKGNIVTLNNKLTYDMARCQSQVLSQKEICDEKVAKAILEVQSKRKQLVSTSALPSEGNKENGTVKEESIVEGTKPDESKNAANLTPVVSQAKPNPDAELQTNDIVSDKELDVQSFPSVASVKDDVLETEIDKAEAEGTKQLGNNLTDDNGIEVMDVHEEEAQADELDPGVEGILISREKGDESLADQKPEEPEEYGADEQMLGGVILEKEEPGKQTENIDKDIDEDQADYNGDEENEGEFEADKQAALAQI